VVDGPYRTRDEAGRTLSGQSSPSRGVQPNETRLKTFMDESWRRKPQSDVAAARRPLRQLTASAEWRIEWGRKHPSPPFHALSLTAMRKSTWCHLPDGPAARRAGEDVARAPPRLEALVGSPTGRQGSFQKRRSFESHPAGLDGARHFLLFKGRLTRIATGREVYLRSDVRLGRRPTMTIVIGGRPPGSAHLGMWCRRGGSSGGRWSGGFHRKASAYGGHLRPRASWDHPPSDGKAMAARMSRPRGRRRRRRRNRRPWSPAPGGPPAEDEQDTQTGVKLTSNTVVMRPARHETIWALRSRDRVRGREPRTTQEGMTISRFPMRKRRPSSIRASTRRRRRRCRTG